MKPDLTDVLNDVPLSVSDNGEGILLRCQILRTSVGHAKIIFEDICLVVSEQSVDNLCELQLSADYMRGCLVPFMVQLRRSAPILDIQRSDIFEQLVSPSQRPFSVAVRPRTTYASARTAFGKLEHEFLLKHKLLSDPNDIDHS